MADGMTRLSQAGIHNQVAQRYGATCKYDRTTKNGKDIYLLLLLLIC